MNSNEIRNMFLSFFKRKNHVFIKESSLISKSSDLLFTNSGMNQFKDLFLLENNKLNFTRVVNSQKCIRVGGKHDDLNNIGYTLRHNTLFEMLGNFSFGDYFKEESINFSWELLTNKNWFNLDKNKIFITVYYSDEESENIWKKIGISKNKIIKIKDINKNNKYISNNFWQMSNIGPCGPCTEIFYDLGDNFKGKFTNKSNIGDRYIEIWNLVFIQFNKDINGNLIKLNMNSVDTGMGLERVSSIIQNVNSNYKIDIFINLVEIVKNKLNLLYNKKNIKYIKIIADHVRTSIFILYNKIIPSNEKHGYVLRKIIRRACCCINMLGINYPILYTIINNFIEYMKLFYYDFFLSNYEIGNIEKIILNEEEKFINLINYGLLILKKNIDNNIIIKNNKKLLDGNFVFKLYDTYGLPIDIIINFCKKYNINIDKLIFNELMSIQKINNF
ncbi:alanine--tRNA ligase [endosymbiont of Sipalinus gigas]|nr:alanine--tRNA ligase [endosymbiont of Sipalinus gigas]